MSTDGTTTDPIIITATASNMAATGGTGLAPSTTASFGC
jgi:hypothetical protein